eukprot:RCo046559
MKNSFSRRFASTLHSAYNHPLLRDWQSARCNLRKEQLIFPIFVTDHEQALEPITALPGNFHVGVGRLSSYLEPLVKKGLRSVLLFGVPTNAAKDEHGTPANDANGPVIRAVKELRRTFPDLYVACDVCLCAYTSHGHCGIPEPPSMKLNNRASVARLTEVALSYAEAGCHMVAPSDMMDGRIGSIKEALLAAGRDDVALMSYAAKFASVFYGPFRSACSTSLKGNRKDYQLPPASEGLAKQALLRDAAEGADVIMVKPGLPYLDIVRLAREVVATPIAVYQVSGEFAMIHYAAAAGALELRPAVEESLLCLRRAGADVIITYFTPLLLDWIDH